MTARLHLARQPQNSTLPSFAYFLSGGRRCTRPRAPPPLCPSALPRQALLCSCGPCPAVCSGVCGCLCCFVLTTLHGRACWWLVLATPLLAAACHQPSLPCVHSMQTACWRQARCCSSRLAGGTTSSPPLSASQCLSGGAELALSSQHLAPNSPAQPACRCPSGGAELASSPPARSLGVGARYCSGLANRQPLVMPQQRACVSGPVAAS